MAVADTTLYPIPPKIKTSADAPRLAIALPIRKTSPVEFWMQMLQLLAPLNVKMCYAVQKGADVPGGKLPAAARNTILEAVIAQGIDYVLFLDDDVLVPDITTYRLLIQMQKHPEAACITGVYGTKLEPTEPLLYADDGSGAYWDWPLGALVPIHSAGAGVMMVRTAYAAKLAPPWFNDVYDDMPDGVRGRYTRRNWGHDRFFHVRLREEGGGAIYADTGLLCAHWDTELQRAYVIPPDAPCFQREPLGDAYVSALDGAGDLVWRRLVPPRAKGDARFIGWLDSLSGEAGSRVALLSPETSPSVVDSVTPAPPITPSPVAA